MMAISGVGLRTPWWRYWLDVVLLVAFSMLFPRLLYEIGIRSAGGGLDLGFMTLMGLAPVLAGWALLRLRGERLADVGLRPPRNWIVTLASGLLIAAVVFGFVHLAEQFGMKRDLSRFSALEGDLKLTLWAVGFAFIGAAFAEEFLFRGFIMRSAAGGLGDGRVAWGLAVVIQAVLFAVSHGYQGPAGLLLTGGIALAVGIVVLANGRNLWPAIIGHGLYDASRFIYFYLAGPPG